MFLKTMIDIGSAIKIDDGLKKASELNINSVVLMDKTMYALPDFYRGCKKRNIKPIVGVEVTISGLRCHIICKNKKGYQKIISKLENGISFSSIAGDDNISVIISGYKDESDLKKISAVLPYKNVYVGIHSAIGNTAREMEQAKALWTLSDESKRIPLFIPTHVEPGEENTVKVLKAVRESIGKTVSYTKYSSQDEIGKHIQRIEDVKINGSQLYKGELSFMIKNYNDLLDSCVDDYDFGKPIPPKFPFLKETIVKINERDGVALSLTIPQNRLFLYLVSQKAKQITKDMPKNKKQEYLDRAMHEVNVILNMGFDGYFLVISDIVSSLKEVGIEVGPGRGSAVGSLVAYLLDITKVDPIEHGLIFERFLNPDRVSMPDIDLDIPQDERKRAIDLLYQKYGKERISQIATVSVYGAKGALKDCARVLDYPASVGEALSKLIETKDNSPLSIEDTYRNKKDEVENVLARYNAENVWLLASKIEGYVKNFGIHASGVVVSERPISEVAPLMQINDTRTVQFDSYGTEYMSLIKADLLGLKTLTVIKNTLSLIESNGKKVTLPVSSFNDPSVYELFSYGDLSGVFQMESDGMQQLSRDIKPKSFADISVLLALYRPGVLKSNLLESFKRRARGEEDVTYFHEEFNDVLEPILKETYGVIVYQEQVMNIVKDVGGFTNAEADSVRRAMSKKNNEELKAYKEKFIIGARNNGYSEKNAGELFDLVNKFAGYGFNKSHTTAYAIIAYQTAYLKKHFPLEFMSALMSLSDNSKIEKYVKALSKEGIKVVNPDINNSFPDFYPDIENNTILFGLKNIKGIGTSVAQKIVNIREGLEKTVKDNLFDFSESEDNGAMKYESIDDFRSKLGSVVHSDALKALAMSGAFNCFSGYENAINEVFGTSYDTIPADRKIDFEKKVFGFSLSDPFEKARPFLSKYEIPEFHTIIDQDNEIKKPVYIVGLPTLIEPRKNKKGNTYLKVQITYNNEEMSLFVHNEKAINEIYEIVNFDEESSTWTPTPVVFGVTKSSKNDGGWLSVASEYSNNNASYSPAVHRFVKSVFDRYFKKSDSMNAETHMDIKSAIDEKAQEEEHLSHYKKV